MKIKKVFNKFVLCEMQNIQTKLTIADEVKMSAQKNDIPFTIFDADADTGLVTGDKVMLNIPEGMKITRYKIDGKDVLVIPLAFIVCQVSN